MSKDERRVAALRSRIHTDPRSMVLNGLSSSRYFWALSSVLVDQTDEVPEDLIRQILRTLNVPVML